MVVQITLDQCGGFFDRDELNEVPSRVVVPERRVVYGWNLLEDAESLLVSPLQQLGLSDALLRHPVAGIDRERLPQLLEGLVEQPDMRVDQPQMMVRSVEVRAELHRTPVFLNRPLVGELFGRTPQHIGPGEVRLREIRVELEGLLRGEERPL